MQGRRCWVVCSLVRGARQRTPGCRAGPRSRPLAVEAGGAAPAPALPQASPRRWWRLRATTPARPHQATPHRRLRAPAETQPSARSARAPACMPPIAQRDSNSFNASHGCPNNVRLRAAAFRCPHLQEQGGRCLGLRQAQLLHGPPRRQELRHRAQQSRGALQPCDVIHHHARAGESFAWTHSPGMWGRAEPTPPGPHAGRSARRPHAPPRGQHWLRRRLLHALRHAEHLNRGSRGTSERRCFMARFWLTHALAPFAFLVTSVWGAAPQHG